MRTLFSIAFLLFFSISSFSQKVLAETEFKAENVTQVNIDASFVDVRISKGSEVYMKGVIEGSGDPEDYNIYSDVSGDVLEIRVDRRGNGWNRTERSIIELTVTDNVDIRVDNSSGDVIARGISTDRVNIETSSGDIQVEDVTAEVSLSSSSGDIEVEKIRGDLEVESSSGDQSLYFVNGNLEFDATSGDVTVRSHVGELEGETTSGDIEIYRFEGSIDIRATSGDIEGESVIFTSDSRFKTSSGDIYIQMENDIDEMSFDLEASSGNLNVGGRRSDKSLYMKQGEIWITGISSSGSQRYEN